MVSNIIERNTYRTMAHDVQWTFVFAPAGAKRRERAGSYSCPAKIRIRPYFTLKKNPNLVLAAGISADFASVSMTSRFTSRTFFEPIRQVPFSKWR